MKKLILTLIFKFLILFDSVESIRRPPRIKSEQDATRYRVGQIVQCRASFLIVDVDRDGRHVIKEMDDDQKTVFRRIFMKEANLLHHHEPDEENPYYIPPFRYSLNQYLVRKEGGRARRIGEVTKVDGVLTLVKREEVGKVVPEVLELLKGDELYHDRAATSSSGLDSREHIATYWNRMWLPPYLLPANELEAAIDN